VCAASKSTMKASLRRARRALHCSIWSASAVWRSIDGVATVDALATRRRSAIDSFVAADP